MRRMLISLPIALLISSAVFLPYSVNAESHLFTDTGVSIDNRVHTGPSVFTTPAIEADDASDLPEGLTLTKGVPFISPVEVDQGKIVTIKVKATNDSLFDITYPLAVKINGTAVGTAKQLSLGPAESEDVVFTVTAQTAGNNDVKVGNLQGFFTVKSGSFFDMFPPYLWGFFGIVLGVIVMLIVLMVTKPSRKGKAGAQPDLGKKQAKGKGKPGQPGGPDAFPFPGQMPRPGMPGMPEGMPMGMQGPGQPGAPYDMSMPGMMPGGQQPGQPPSAMGMQPQFQSQPGMPPPLPHQTQPGMAPPTLQGMHSLSMQGPQYPQGPQGPQYPQAPHMPQAGQQHPGQPPMQGMPPGMQPQPGHGMPPGMQPQPGHGMPPPISGAPLGQPGMPFGVQPPPAPPMPHMPPQQGPGMPQGPHTAGQPPMQAMGPQGMYPPMQPGAQQQAMPFQQMGMPKFTVSNLTITPNHVKVGEPVNVSIIVSNNGAQMGKYSVVLRVGGVVENITDMSLTPGASQTAGFVVVKDAAGDYYADIDGLGGFFTVIPLTPPSFTVSNFSISPERVRQGQPVIITASVTNTGEITGSHPLILRIKGIAEAHDITLSPGKTQDVEFQIVKDTPGFYPVSMENWTGKFVVEMDWTG